MCSNYNKENIVSSHDKCIKCSPNGADQIRRNLITSERVYINYQLEKEDQLQKHSYHNDVTNQDVHVKVWLKGKTINSCFNPNTNKILKVTAKVNKEEVPMPGHMQLVEDKKGSATIKTQTVSYSCIIV